MASKFTSKGAKVYAVPEGEDGYDYNRGPTIIDLPKVRSVTKCFDV